MLKTILHAGICRLPGHGHNQHLQWKKATFKHGLIVDTRGQLRGKLGRDARHPEAHDSQAMMNSDIHLLP